MDFVASRATEKKFGWRNRVGDVIRAQEGIVFDQWFKPAVRGLHQYGLEDVNSIDARENWTFESGEKGDAIRAEIAEKFWETLHIDLRMVDTSDFTIAYCPTNIYSVGTAHEIILSRQQLKPVLFVSPPVSFPSLDKMRAHLKDDKEGLALLEKLAAEVPIKPNPRGIPSMWYMPLIGSGNFFDGFGFFFALNEALQFFALAGAEIGGRIETAAFLRESRDHFVAQRLRQFAQFVE